MAKKIEIGLDASGIIRDYRAAITAMEQAGAKSSITSGLTKSLDRLEQKFKDLANEGALGKETSKEIENFQKRVNSTYSSLGQLGKEMERLAKNKKTFPTSAINEFEKKIEEAKSKVTEIQQAFTKQFTKLGLTEGLAETLKTEEDVRRVLEEQLRLRQKNVEEAKKAADAAREEAGKSVKISGPILSTNNISKTSSFNKDERNLIQQSINEEIVKGIRSGEEFAQVWERIVAGEKAFFSSESELQTFITDIDQLKNKIQEIIDKRDKLAEQSSAGQNYKNAVATRDQLGSIDTSGAVNFSNDAQAVINGTTESYQRLAEAEQHVVQLSQEESTARQKTEQDLAAVTAATRGLVEASETSRVQFNGTSKALYDTAKAAEKTSNSFNLMKSRILMLLSATSIFNLIKRQVKETYEDVKTLDKSFASIAMVTKYSVDEMWGSYSLYADMAAELGQKTNSVIQASALFYQQGLDTNEALELTTDTMKLATLAGNDFQTATQEMTSALRGFKMEMDEGGHVTDVYSELAAHAAASVDDIAQAMARTASIANSAGMSFENTSAFLTQMIETTQESAENIGTSLKTIIARFTELKENVAGTSDSEFEDLDYNKVDKALKSVGVSLKDATGQFRDLDQVFIELSEKWDTLDRNTQRYVATIAAGSRQQSRFIAMMDNYDRTVELMNLAADAEGKADEQFAKYADTMEYKLNQLSTKWEEFRVQLLDSDFFKGMIDGLSGFLDRLKNIDFKKVIAIAPFAIFAAKTFITNLMNTISSAGTMIAATGRKIGQRLATGVETGIGKIGQKIAKLLGKEYNPKVAINQVQLELQIKQIQQNLEALKAKYGEISFNAALNINPESATIVRDLANQMIQAGVSTEIVKDQMKQFGVEVNIVDGQVEIVAKDLEQASNTIRNLSDSARKGVNSLNSFSKSSAQLTARSAAVTAAWQGVASAITMAVSALTTGAASWEEAGKMILKMMITTGIQMTMTAFTTSYQTGMSIGEGLNAGLAATGIGLIIVAIGAAIGALFIGIGALANAIKGNKKTLEEQLNEAKKNAEEAKKLASETSSQKKDAQSEAKATKELREEYEELSNKVHRTNEEQQRYEELVDEIREKLPEVVISYNEVTGELVTQNELWDSIINKAEKTAKIANRTNYMAQLNAINADTKVAEATYAAQVATPQRYLSFMDAAEKYQFTSTNAQGVSETSYFADLLATAQRQEYLSDKGIEDYSQSDIEKLAKHFAENYYGSADSVGGEDIASALQEYVNSHDVEDSRKFLTVLSELDGHLSDMSSESKEFIENYKAENDNIIGEYDRQLEEQKKLNEEIIKAQKAIWIKDELDVSESVADFMVDRMDFGGITSDEITEASGKYFAKTIGGGKDKWSSVEEMGDYAGKNKGGTADNLDKWDTLTGKGPDANGIAITDVIQKMNDLALASGQNLPQLTASSWNAARRDDEDWEKLLPTLEYFDEAYQAVYEEQRLKMVQLSEEEQKAVEDFYSKLNNSTAAQLESEKNILIASMDSDEDKQYAEQKAQEFIDNLNKTISETEEKVGASNGTLDGWTQSQITALNTAFDALSEKMPEGADKFTTALINEFKTNSKFTKDQLLGMMQIPWDEIDLSNFSQYQDQILEILEQTFSEEEAKELADKFVTEATKAGIASFGVKSQDVVNSITDSIEEGLEKWIKGYSDLGDAITAQLKDGFISFTQSQEVEKALAELGLEASEYLDFTDDGKVILNEEKLTQEFRNQLNNADAILEVANKETQAKIDELSVQRDSIIAERDLLIATKQRLAAEQDILITRQQQFNMNLSGQAKTYADKTLDIYRAQRAGTTEEINNINSEYADKLKDINNQIVEYQSGLNSIKPGSKEYLETQNKIKAALREISTMRDSYLPDEEKVKSVADATKDHEQALEDLAKAQEDVAEKQEKLNEALEEYNDLLYGKDNRKSSLDYLYNYDEAINSFNDEISRSKDLLADSKSIEDSTVALQRYANATHNLVAEETAKQQVIQAGLKNYADMIENGNYAYTNRETGQTTNVNFGDYARKDNRTGKYIIDQRLINEAKFTDDIKDLLEEQVSNYNKYRDELLKSEDNVRKAEKELQEQRKTALNNYAAMETEIAEALKAQYQEEVDALKNKYDAMKDADDDYLDALQDAIDKQRQLRDKENKYEDLAQKEKKLSLMQRDTSGANELETRQLEKEVQQDRESLLDEAIDEIIDGLSELYESQQELRDSEMELKEALLDNTLYWNTQAESLAGSFESAEDYAQFLSGLSEEYSMMTLAQQQVKLQEYGETYTAASEYMAMQAMDNASETGNFIVDTMTITGEEVGTIVAETAETFSTEVIRSYNETTAAFEEDMRKAEESIDSAKDALQEAINKLNECAAAANTAAQALRDAQVAQSSGGGDLGYEDNFGGVESTYIGPANGQLVDWVNLKDTMDGMAYSINSNGSVENGTIAFGANSSTTHGQLASYIQKLYRGNELEELQKVTTALGLSTTDGNSSTPLNSYQLYNKIKERLIAADATLTSVFKYKEGGLVNYTGPAWVDGSPERPEAFLNSEDTARIGEAAKILADIPWMDRDTDNASVVTNNGGDVSVEINLNIDHISSDTDIDEMIQRVKDEIVDVARPEGTNVILQQQLN